MVLLPASHAADNAHRLSQQSVPYVDGQPRYYRSWPKPLSDSRHSGTINSHHEGMELALIHWIRCAGKQAGQLHSLMVNAQADVS